MVGDPEGLEVADIVTLATFLFLQSVNDCEALRLSVVSVRKGCSYILNFSPFIFSRSLWKCPGREVLSFSSI